MLEGYIFNFIVPLILGKALQILTNIRKGPRIFGKVFTEHEIKSLFSPTQNILKFCESEEYDKVLPGSFVDPFFQNIEKKGVNCEQN